MHSIPQIFKSGLTATANPAIMSPVADASATGRGNPFLYKAKNRHNHLWLFYAHQKHRRYRALCFVMAGCFGQRSALAAPCSGFSTPFQPVTHAVESIGGGYPLSIQGFTA